MTVGKSDARFLYFTESYPFGLGEEWKRIELEVFRDYFADIHVVPLHYAGNKVPKEPIPGIVYHPPLFPQGLPEPLRPESLRAIVASRALPLFLMEFLRQRIYTSRPRLDRWLRAGHFALELQAHKGLAELLSDEPGRTILYFFWARGASEILPLLDTSRFKKTVLRLHNYDLYADHLQGWVPFQKEQVRHADELLPCSDHGTEYLRAMYPELSRRVRTARLGTSSRGQSSQSEDGILRIVTCSMVVRAKRLPLLADALAHVSSPVHWSHIGDGELFPDLQQRVEALQQKRSNVRVELVGRLRPSDVAKFYVEHPVDLLINVSDSEGLPVSIMEAFAAGIPTYATAVAGTPEIVDQSCGKLWPPDVSPVSIAQDIERFARLAPSDRAKLREAAFAKFERLFDAERNARELAESLTR